jgi:2-keto-4-pentenoate hydratase/2-oxohepta-3-ene-1,7-dioic acid hydratase in catechol pathway
MTRFVRYQDGSRISYGFLQDGEIEELEGDLWSHRPTGRRRGASSVKLLTPCEPGKVLAVGRNYKSHAVGRGPVPVRPELFFKPISCLQNPGDPILIPPGASDVHYEGELVLVMGTRLRFATKQQAHAAIFGATCGNDVSERQWQSGPEKDLQWWRAKGSDTFGPLGPEIVTGVDYDNVRVQTRLNGELVQDQSTADLIFDCATIVSFISQYLTLERGDVIYTGTPGATQPMKPGDVVEVSVEGVGVLANPIAAA